MHSNYTSWLWIPKSACLGELGFPASVREVHQWGWQARVVKRIRDPSPLKRTFAEVVRGEELNWGRGWFPNRFGGGANNIGGEEVCF